jgi:uncharacterized membrane protein YfcA
MAFWIFAIAAAIGQLIDGALGMGFGVVTSTMLLTLGASAAVSSAAVHMAEIATTLASGSSHWFRDNVDKDMLKKLAIPGGIGAFIGANFLSNIDLSSSKTFITTVLMLLGFVLLYRSVFNSSINMTNISSKKYFRFLGFTGGFIDASGGGGWGPVVTPTLMSTTAVEPRKIVGTVSASEFIVALSASLGFLININKIDLDWSIVGGLALGGVIMAPIAAKIVTAIDKKTLGILIASAIILINGYKLVA